MQKVEETQKSSTGDPIKLRVGVIIAPANKAACKPPCRLCRGGSRGSTIQQCAFSLQTVPPIYIAAWDLWLDGGKHLPAFCPLTLGCDQHSGIED